MYLIALLVHGKLGFYTLQIFLVAHAYLMVVMPNPWTLSPPITITICTMPHETPTRHKALFSLQGPMDGYVVPGSQLWL
jgi:hypothetical protein